VAAARHLGCDALGVGLGPSSIDNVQLTVQHKPLFKLFCSEAYQYAHRGTVYPYLMQVERLDGFDGPIHLEVADRQIMDLDGADVREITVPPGVSQFMLPIYLPETMHINIQPHSNVYSQAYVQFQDKWGQDQSLLVVSTMRCMIRTLPTVVKLKAQEIEVAIRPGDTVACHLVLERTANFSGGMRIELIEPAVAAGFSAEPVAIAPGESAALLTVRTPAPLRPEFFSSAPVLRFRATGTLAGGAQVISEATVVLLRR
jgi:hypothetical protein